MLKKDKIEELKTKVNKRNRFCKSFGAGRGQEQCLLGGGASVWHTLADKRCQRGRKHQHFGLHEGQIRQSGDHFSRLFTQILFLPGFPVQTGSDQRAAAMLVPSEFSKNSKKFLL